VIQLNPLPESLKQAIAAFACPEDAERGADSSGGARFARDAAAVCPLDLINEHLTDIPFETTYSQGMCAGEAVNNWYFPDGWVAPFEAKTPVLKVQPLANGGYEATVSRIDLSKVGRALEFGGKRATRETPDEINPQHVAIAAQRAKKRVRLLVKNMMATHLVTFTKREPDGSEYWDEGQWLDAWDRFRRNMVRHIGVFPYVAILEKHKKGNFHLHAAWCGRVNVKLVRRLWLAVIGGGKGCGNIDAKQIKVPAGGDRASRIARYISKYVSKMFELDSRFNKKRYWASKQTLEDARRYVLRSISLDSCLAEVASMLGLDYRKFTLDGRRDNFFVFPSEDGFWINYIPELHAIEPPF